MLEPNRLYTFGRTARARVLFPDVRVSRAHGDLEMHGGSWHFTDLSSSNGSFVFRVADLDRTDAVGADLPCLRIAPGRRARLRSGDGVLLGCRDAWLELLSVPPPGALRDVARVNPPSVLAVLGLKAVREAETPDLDWPDGELPLPAPRELRDLR